VSSALEGSCLFSSPEHKVLRVSYCDRSLSVVRRRASCVNFLAHLSTKCSGWAIVIGLCPSLSVVRRPSCVNFFTKTSSPLKPLIGFWPNFTGMIPGWSPTKVVQIVPVGCISRSQGQKIGFQNAIFKNLLVWNCRAQSSHIWYIASSRGPLPKLFKLYPWGQNWPRPGGHNFTLNYIRKTANNFFSWTAYGNLTKPNRNGPWVVPYINCSNGSEWLHK